MSCDPCLLATDGTEEGEAASRRSTRRRRLGGGRLLLVRVFRIQLADDGVRSILADDALGVDHVELLTCILASKVDDGELATRVVLQEVCHVQDLAVEDDPAILLAVVAGNIGGAVDLGHREEVNGRGEEAN